LIPHNKEVDVDNKFNNYFKITGIINNMFGPQRTLKKTIIKLHSTVALPALIYGSENWTIEGRDAKRITAAEMKCVRKRVGYTWTVNKINTDIAKELNLTPVLDKIEEYGRNWLQHINRMPRIGSPRIPNNYRPTGRRNQGKTLQRLRDL